MRGTDPRARTGNGWDARSDQRIARQRVVLEGLEAGMRVKDAVALAGVSMASYTAWRKRDLQFKAECQVARAAGMGAIDEHPGRFYSFAEFRKHYFAMDTYVHQAQIVDALENVKPREIVLVNIWPEAGKTTTVEDWICQQLGMEPNLRMTDVSESSGLCKKSVARIKARMTDTRNFGKFIAAFGPFYNDGQEREGKPWAKEYFTVAKSDHDERDYSLEARAITSAAYGTRIDVLIVDDIQSRKNLAQTDTIFEHLRQTYFTRGRAMRTVIIGTRIDNGDVYEKMIDAGIIDRYITIPAVQPDGTITCPELWGIDRADFTGGDGVCDEEAFILAVKERVAKVRNTVGERVWWASYMQMPEVAGLATFTPEMIDGCKDPMRRVARADVTDFVAMSLDPALGGGNVITACAHDLDKLRILDQRVDYGFSRTEDILLGLEDFAQRYAPVVCIIERDAFQKGLVNDDRLGQIARQYGFQIVPHTTSKAKADPILGCASMAGDFIRGDVSIPWQDDFTKQRMEPLIAQLRAWRPDVSGRLLKQDAVMSLWFNWRYWKENLLARATPVDAWNRGGTPYAPTPYATVTAN